MKTYSLFSAWLRVAATYAGVALSLLVLAPLALPESPPPLLGRFIFTGDFNTARAFHTATLLRDGRVLVAGGYTDSASRSAELYDPRSRTWTPTGDLITARNAHTATLLLDGKVLVAGGSRTNAAPIREAELYDPATGTWTSAGNLRQARPVTPQHSSKTAGSWSSEERETIPMGWPQPKFTTRQRESGAQRQISMRDAGRTRPACYQTEP